MENSASRDASSTSVLMDSKNRKTKNDCYGEEDGTMRISQRRNRKPRLKWTKELHQYFVQAVNQLGGAHEATPKNIVKLMGIKEITSNHIKSHLQKYRHSKEFCKITRVEAAENVMQHEANQEHQFSRTDHAWHISEDIQIGKAQKGTVEGQRNFPEVSKESEKFQQQMQRSKGKDLIAVLERIPEMKKGQKQSSEEAKSKKDQLCDPETFQNQMCSQNTCLTLCKVTKENQETHKVGDEADSDIQSASNEIEKKNKLEKDDTVRLADRPLDFSLADKYGNAEELESKGKLANDFGLQDTKADVRNRFLEGRQQTRAARDNSICALDMFTAQLEPALQNKSKLTSFVENGPLYGSRESNLASKYQPFDLNVPVPDEQQGKE